MSTCTVCSVPTGDGGRLCVPHADHLQDELHAVTAIEEDLVTTYARMANFRGTDKVVGISTEKPLVWDDRIPSRLEVLESVLVGWARVVVRRAHIDRLPTIPVTRDPKDPARISTRVTDTQLAARLLAEHIEDVRQLDEAGQVYNEVIDALTAARRVVDRPAQRRYIGVCSAVLESDAPSAGSDGTCATDLYVHPHRAVARCPGCGAEHDVAHRREILLRAVHDQLVTYHEAERALPDLLGAPVKISTLRNWVSTRRLIPVAYRHAGTLVQEKVGYHDQPLLKVADIIREVTRVHAGQGWAA